MLGIPVTTTKARLPTNWKTTVSACVTVLAGFVALHPEYFSSLISDIAQYITLGGLAAFGLAAKDKDITGGTRAQ